MTPDVQERRASLTGPGTAEPPEPGHEGPATEASSGSPVEGLRARLEEQIRAAQLRDESRSRAARAAMEALEDQWRRFGVLADRWMKQVVVPRLTALAELFPNASSSEYREGSTCASVAFRSTDAYPVSAKVEVALVQDRACRLVAVRFRPSIIPILMDCQPDSSIELDLQESDTARLEEFLDERLVRFAADYLRVRDPDSAYQRDLLVTDPVCGMRFRRYDAAASFEYEGRQYHFCVPACRDKFSADPQRYLRRAPA